MPKIVNLQLCFLSRTGHSCDKEISKLYVLIKCLVNYRHTCTKLSSLFYDENYENLT